MNKEIMKALGFTAEVAAVEANRCPFCGKEINHNDFTDELSKREFRITGLCQSCQNETFPEPDEKEPVKMFTIGAVLQSKRGN